MKTMYMRNRHTWAFVWAAVLLAAGTSCHKAGPEPDLSAPLVCRVEAAGVTKGGSETTTASLQSSGMGVFAWRTDAGKYFDARERYLDNAQFVYSAPNFSATPAEYWPLGSWLSFFAYAPYMADVETGDLKFPSDDYVAGDFPRIQYAPSSTVSSQVDLCLSAPVLDRASDENGGVVPLTFTHVLTRVKLQARWTGTDGQIAAITSGGMSVRILSISFRNILGSNALTYSRTTYQWDAPTALEMESRATQRYDLSVDNGCFASVALPQSPTYSSSFVVDPAGVLYLLPQALVPTAKIVLTYAIFNSSNVQEGDAVMVEYNIGNLSHYRWPAGHEVTYSITLDLSGREPVIEANAGMVPLDWASNDDDWGAS